MDNPNKNYHSLSRPDETRKRYSPTAEQRALVMALWERMTQLYGHKWQSAQGRAATEAGHLTPNFMLWCRKTAHLTKADWARGFKELEDRLQVAGRTGEACWPPAYAEFVGMAEKPVGIRAHKVFPVALPEPKAVRETRRQLGQRKCAALLSMFEE